MNTTEGMIEIIRAHQAGKKIEGRQRGGSGVWLYLPNPKFNFDGLEYRVYVEPPKTYTVTLTEHEANALQAIYWVTGGATTSARGASDSFHAKLRAVGHTAKLGNKLPPLAGSITFTD